MTDARARESKSYGATGLMRPEGILGANPEEAGLEANLLVSRLDQTEAWLAEARVQLAEVRRHQLQLMMATKLRAPEPEVLVVEPDMVITPAAVKERAPSTPLLSRIAHSFRSLRLGARLSS